MRIQPSQSKNKLFVGGIPHDLTREVLEQQLLPLVKGEPPRGTVGRAACLLLLLLHMRPALRVDQPPGKASQAPGFPALTPLSHPRRSANLSLSASQYAPARTLLLPAWPGLGPP